MDIRARRTRAMLFSALEQLLEEKTLEEVSISEICELSTVRRGTFYRHFDDKYDFVKQYFASVTEKLMAEIEASEADVDMDDLETYAPRMHAGLIAFFLEHRGMARRNLQKGVLSDTIDMMVHQAAQGITERIESYCAASGRKLDTPAEFISYFHTAGMIHTLRWWLNSEQPIPAEELEQRCTRFLMRLVDDSSKS